MKFLLLATLTLAVNSHSRRLVRRATLPVPVELGEQIGEGGSGQVFRAINSQSKQPEPYVLKCVHGDLVRKKILVNEYIKSELMTMDPHVIKVYRIPNRMFKWQVIMETDEDGKAVRTENREGYCMPMELGGKQLGSYVRRMLKNNQLTLEQLANLMHQLMYTLSKMHEQNISHCDLSANNVVMVGDIPKYIDFSGEAFDNVNTKYVLDNSEKEYVLSPGQGNESSENCDNDLWRFGQMLKGLLKAYMEKHPAPSKELDLGFQLVKGLRLNRIDRTLQNNKGKWVANVGEGQILTAKAALSHPFFTQFRP